MITKSNQILEKFFFYIVISLPILFIFGSAILNISIFVLNIVFIIHVLSNKNFDYFVQNRFYFTFLLIYLAFQIVNNITNQNYLYFDKSLYYIRFLILPLVFKYFTRFIKFDFYKISKFYLIILIFIFLDLIYQYKFDVNLLGFQPGLFNPGENIYERYAGVFNQELVMGSYLSSFGFLIITIFYNFNKKNDYVLLILLGLLFFSIFITGERSSLFIFLISIFFIFVFIKHLRKKFIFLGALIFIISIIGINVNDQLKLRYYDYPISVLLHEDDFKNDKKIKINFSPISSYSNFINKTHWGMHYKTAGEMFKEKPLGGYGFKQFRIKCKNYSYLFEKDFLKASAKIDGCSTHPHNYILEILSEQGILGFLILLFLVFYVVRDSLKITNHRVYILFLFSIILGYMLPIKPSGSIISTWFSSIFWLMLSFSYIKSKNSL